MTTLMGVLMLAAPIAAVVAFGVMVERRRARRQAAVARQIALTDALHARLGGVVAPFVRRAAGRWQVAVAVPFEQPAVVTGVLGAIEEQFGRGGYEVLLTRQAAPDARPRARRAAPMGEESLSWT